MVRNILAIVIGLILGGCANMGLIILGPSLIAPPSGVDVTSVESLAASMHLFKPMHFVMPFLAHALGTLVGSVSAYIIASSSKKLYAMIIAIAFFLGGVANSFLIPAPLWFIAVDLIVAYIPMAYIAIWLGKNIVKGESS